MKLPVIGDHLKNIITSLFPQQEGEGWGIFLIRTADELAIKLLSQTLARSMRCVCVQVLNLYSEMVKNYNSGRRKIIKVIIITEVPI